MGFECEKAYAQAQLGQRDEADALYERVVTEDPTNGNHWIVWSNLYNPTTTDREHADVERAESILRKGLEVDGLLDQKAVKEHLAALCRADGRASDAKAAMNVGQRQAEVNVGPNSRCPCGSGKKYKKCCGRFA